MDMSQFAGNSYLKFADVEKTGPITATIAEIKYNAKFDKADIFLDDGTILSCNATNARTLLKAYGAESNDWIGKTIKLFAGELEYNGKMNPAILVEPVSPPPEKKAPAKPKKPKPDMDDAVPF